MNWLYQNVHPKAIQNMWLHATALFPIVTLLRLTSSAISAMCGLWNFFDLRWQSDICQHKMYDIAGNFLWKQFSKIP